MLSAFVLFIISLHTLLSFFLAILFVRSLRRGRNQNLVVRSNITFFLSVVVLCPLRCLSSPPVFADRGGCGRRRGGAAQYKRGEGGALPKGGGGKSRSERERERERCGRKRSRSRSRRNATICVCPRRNRHAQCTQTGEMMARSIFNFLAEKGGSKTPARQDNTQVTIKPQN